LPADRAGRNIAGRTDDRRTQGQTMTIRMIAAGLALALAVSGCSKPADPAPTAAAGKPGRGGPPKAPADPMAGARTYLCANDEELHVVFNREKTAATVRMDDGVAAYLPREQKTGIEAYTDGTRTLGVSTSGDLAYTETPAPPKVCRAPVGDPVGVKEKEKAVSGDLPAPKASDVTRNLTVADKGKTIDMKVGEKVSISLVGIPTAGYVWAADKTPSCVKVTSGPSGPTIAAQKQPGYAGGNHWEVLVVEAVKPGDGDLVLAMRRPWENKSEPDAETFTVKLKVK
jgi:predicted secreted protein